jgi:hypothetical protein
MNAVENKANEAGGEDDRRRGKGKRSKGDRKTASSQPEQAVDPDAPVRSLRSAKSTSVVLPEDLLPVDAVDVDEENKRYCYCDRPSFGEVK